MSRIAEILARHLGKKLNNLHIVCRERDFSFNPGECVINFIDDFLLVIDNETINYFKYDEIINIFE